MRLGQLLAELALAPPPTDPEIKGLAYDSRRVEPRYLFIAIPGSHTDGHQYVGEAVQRGAVAVVVERPVGALPAAVVQVADTRRALAELSAAFYSHPSRDLTLIGITGTDGKTTTTILLHRILQEAGMRAAALNTVDVRVGEEVRPNPSRQTTPESLEIQAELRALADQGFQAAVLETSSHALALERVTGCEFDVGVLTNLSHEHLDFHGTPEAYREAKGRLFEMLGAGRAKRIPSCGVLNRDDPEFDYFQRRSRAPLLTYGEVLPADLQAGDVQETVAGVHFSLRTPTSTFPVHMQLAGRWNVLNGLAAAGAAVAVGVPPEAIRRGLEGVARVPGRMERVDLGQPFAVIIDYAHTPQSLEKVLRALRPVTRGRLGAVFGSAGERDREKRPWMGEIAARLADYAVITDEDPREEDPQAIFAEIAAGALACGKREGTDFVRIAGRAAAIAHAVAWARPGDTLVLAGKGHESSIIVGRTPVPYDERATVEAALRGQGVANG